MNMFLTWLWVALLLYFLSVASLPLLELADQIIVIRKHLLQTMVPAAAKVTPRGAPTINIQVPQ